MVEMQRTYKWKTAKNNLKDNDFIMIKDHHLPTTDWRLCRIVKVMPGKDKNVRMAEIRTQNGIIVRLLVK